MRILITGAKGMLGHDLMTEWPDSGSLTGVDLQDCDICDPAACRSLLRSVKPDWIINAAAFTAVDECESRSDLAMAVNADGAGNLAKAAREFGARMVQVSTDYVFSGDADRPYLETDPTDPKTVYGKSKLDGENQVLHWLPDESLIVRTAWLFGRNGRNFVDTIIDLATSRTVISVVSDQAGCPTYSRDLAAGIRALIERNARGIVHVTNSGRTTWHGFASYFLGRTHPHVEIKPIGTHEFPRPAPRPKFSVLDPGRFKKLTGGSLPDWRDAVDRYLAMRHSDLLEKTTKE